MPLKTGCTARQCSDQMLCDQCGLQWDTNDPEPPECRRVAAPRKRSLSEEGHQGNPFDKIREVLCRP